MVKQTKPQRSLKFKCPTCLAKQGIECMTLDGDRHRPPHPARLEKVSNQAPPKQAKRRRKLPPVLKKVPSRIEGKGRPSTYRAVHAESVYKMCLLGAIDEDLAKAFDVSVATLNNWKKLHPDFEKNMRMGKMAADAEVAFSLYNRAIGIKVKEVRDTPAPGGGDIIQLTTVKELPGDVAAQKHWLNNRAPDKWKANQEAEQLGNAFSLVINECLKPPTRPPEER